jgi:3-hydroxyisobutyrate dehydrogenase-like beta-hydroxyacid dehydrogenase
LVKEVLLSQDKLVGYIGVGAMGGAMSAQILEHGLELSVYDVDTAAVKALEEKGAYAARSPREVGERSEVVICSLPHPKVFIETALGEQGLIHGMKPGGVVIDMSTNDLKTERDVGAALEKEGIRLIDAPVGKGPWAAIEGDLTVMMGGDREVCRSVEWLLNIVGSKLFYCGPLGSGQVIKLANNLASCANMAVVAEAYALAKAGGADLEVLTEVMPQTSADSWQLRRTLVDKVLKGDFSPMFKLKLAHKDMGLIVEMARALGSPIGCGEATMHWYDEGLKAGYGEMDWGAIILCSNPELKPD